MELTEKQIREIVRDEIEKSKTHLSDEAVFKVMQQGMERALSRFAPIARKEAEKVVAEAIPTPEGIAKKLFELQERQVSQPI